MAFYLHLSKQEMYDRLLNEKDLGTKVETQEGWIIQARDYTGKKAYIHLSPSGKLEVTNNELEAFFTTDTNVIAKITTDMLLQNIKPNFRDFNYMRPDSDFRPTKTKRRVFVSKLDDVYSVYGLADYVSDNNT